jgi:hypothetical protein
MSLSTSSKYFYASGRQARRDKINYRDKSGDWAFQDVRSEKAEALSLLSVDGHKHDLRNGCATDM